MTAVREPRERNKARTRADIEAAALELFEAAGYEATTVEQITARAGVSSATFFRHFPAKEELLFANVEDTTASLVGFLTTRDDSGADLAALAQPIIGWGRDFSGVGRTHAHQLTKLAMTTKALEARSVRMRLAWEKAIALHLAGEHGRTRPTLDETLIAGVAISCLMTALRQWNDDSTDTLEALIRQTFAHCSELTRRTD